MGIGMKLLQAIASADQLESPSLEQCRTGFVEGTAVIRRGNQAFHQLRLMAGCRFARTLVIFA